jgi:hypothetical protein
MAQIAAGVLRRSSHHAVFDRREWRRPGPVRRQGLRRGPARGGSGRRRDARADAGVPMTTLPLTPDRVWRRIRELKIS